MKKIIRILMGSTALLLSVMLFAGRANALGELVKMDVPLTQVKMSEGLEQYTGTATSRHNGGEREDRQIFQAIVKPASSQAVEIISWAAGTDDAWGKSTLTQTAIDFERRNPGYIVLAGVNGDFFDINKTFQPCNNFISNGDVWKKDCLKPTIDPATGQISFNDGYGLLGFKADGSYVLGPAYAEDDMTLKLLNGKVVTDEFKVDVINGLPEGEGIGLYYPNSGTNLNFTGYRVYKGNYEFYRTTGGGSYVGDSTNQPRGSFVKGEIAEVSTSTTIVPSIELGNFYLVSKSQALAEKLTAGQKVKCEYSMTGAFADVTNSMGFSLQCLKNSQPIQAAGTDINYHVNSNPRSLIGFKEDGSIVLMTIDGRQGAIGAVGCSTYEAGEFLRQFGCVNGYNLDGGGSVTSIARNAQGTFDVLNHPSDLEQRALGNALLFVMRDPNVDITDVQTSSITVEQTAPVASGTIRNVKVQISGGGLGTSLEFVPMTGNKVVFDNLNRNTKYTITYNYEIVDEFGRVIRSQNNEVDVFTLGEGVPGIEKFRFAKKTGTSVSFDYEIATYDEVTNIEAKYISYGDLKYDLTDNVGRITIEELEAGINYDFKLVVEYKLNEETKTVSSAVLSYKPAPASTGGCQTGAATGLFGFVSMLAVTLFVLKRRK